MDASIESHRSIGLTAFTLIKCVHGGWDYENDERLANGASFGAVPVLRT
jgi:hypothetical protein